MDTIQLLQKLIQIPSFSGNEKKLINFIVDYCNDTDLPVKIQNNNVIIYLHGKNKSKALIFNAHMDTVSVGNRSKWKYPPIGRKAGKIVNGKIYGLGASDDKAAIASMMVLAKSVNNPPCDLWFTFVCSEETDGSGTAQFLQWFKKTKYYLSYKHIAAIIGEPTNLTNIEIGHRGNAFIKLTSYGITGHGAKTYSRSDLAVEKMLKALNGLQKVFSVWKKKYKHTTLGEPNMNITRLYTSGEFINTLPDKCWATLDIRTTPGLHKNLENLLRETIGKYAEISGMKGNASPGLIEGNSMIIKICRKILPKVHFSISLGSTDFSQFVQSGIDVIVLGPGDKKVIHKENEYVYVSKIKKVVGLYKKILSAYSTV
ncbi:M20/M25/M40 family metallo-hydrolase [Candidatus Gottesmanbacteria bacterium]|nr:M20/M25/M40 family metallo-hydrolase [Candidatus Gottesmanbacteria bacterium]